MFTVFLVREHSFLVMLLIMMRNLFFSTRNIWRKTKSDFGKYSLVVPRNVSDSRPVPDHIKKPIYYQSGTPLGSPLKPEIKNEIQIAKMRNSCKLASRILHEIGKNIKVGQTTDDIDREVHDLCIENNAYPSPLNYRGFPKTVCTSVNNVACHGVPDDRSLQDGDIINVDITVYLDGYHGDCSKTFLVGNVDDLGISLIKATEQCLKEAIELCGPGKKFCALGNHIEYRANKMGYNVVPSLVGHGIGEYFHGPPDIYHCGNNYPGIMKPGMTFTIESALTQGSEEIIILDDGWTAITADNARSAQCEHTVLITETGVEILTLPPE